MAKEFDWSSVNSFAALDKNYELLVQRMKNFDALVVEGSYPKKTLLIYTKELKSYLSIIDKEIEKTMKTIVKQENQKSVAKTKQQAAIGELKLTIKKLQLIKSQLANVYKKWSHLETSKAKTPSISAIQLEQINSLSQKFLGLYESYQALNGKYISVSLDDAFEAEIEAKEGFLRTEVDYLTNLTNMLSKIDAMHKQRKSLSTGILKELKKMWLIEREGEYLITGDIHQSQFKNDYDTWSRKAQGRIMAAQEIQETLLLVDQLHDFDESKKHAKELHAQVQAHLGGYDIFIALKKIRADADRKELTETLGYVKQKEFLLEPFEYSGRYALDEIQVIIHNYSAKIHHASPKQLASMQAERKEIQDNLHHILASLKKISGYRYIPFETLDNAIRKNILLKSNAGEWGVVRAMLSNKIEKTYTKQYQYLISQVGNLTSGGSRSNSSGADILGDLFSTMGKSGGRGYRGGNSFGSGGGRSLGGGSSFGGGWSSSGGTSW